MANELASVTARQQPPFTSHTFGWFFYFACLGALLTACENGAAAGTTQPVYIGGVEHAPLTAADGTLARLKTTFEARPFVLDLAGEPRAFSMRQLGVSLNEMRLRAWLEDEALLSAGLTARLTHLGLGGGDGLMVDVPISVDLQVMTDTLLALKDDIDEPRRRLRYDWKEGAFHAATPGKALHVGATLAALGRALYAGERSTHAVVQAEPEPSSAMLAGLASVAAELSYFETHYDTSNRARNRTDNLRLAAARLDGYVIAPGETFDFNQVVGERTASSGFQAAPVIVAGELEDGLGGGTCQVAGTLHGAAFFAGLPIIERHPHSRPSAYIKLGLDAVVSFPKLNLRFINDYPYPLTVRFSVDKGIARASFHGPKKLREVELVRLIRNVDAFDEREEPAPELPAGAYRLKQRGIPGFGIKVWRTVYDDLTKQGARTLTELRYPPTTQIWLKGTGDVESGEVEHAYVAPNPPPEYVADAYLRMQLGLNKASLQEWTRAGSTGVYGWTEQAGMPPVTVPPSER